MPSVPITERSLSISGALSGGAHHLSKRSVACHHHPEKSLGSHEDHTTL